MCVRGFGSHLSEDQELSMGLIAEGQRAPSFTLPDQNGKKHCLRDYAGRCVVLFFYPKDMTSGCTLEAKDFRDMHIPFADLGVVILGVSILGTKSKATSKETNKVEIIETPTFLPNISIM